jgi:MFS family permease
MNGKGLSRNTLIFSLTSFLVDISTEMVTPLLPFFLTQVLLAPIAIVGLVAAVHEATAYAVGAFSGLYSDSMGKRKKIVLMGYIFSGLMKGFLVITTSWTQAIGIVFLERFGKGIREAPRDALLALSETKENLGRAIGFRKMLDNAGAVLGPVVTTLLLAFLLPKGMENAYRTIFLVALIPAFIAVIALFFVQEKKSELKKISMRDVFGSVMKTPNYKRFVFSAVLFSIGQFAVAFMLLRAGEFMGLEFIPVVYLAYNVFYTIFSLPAGYLSDRIGGKNTLIIGQLLFLAACTGFAFFASFANMFLFAAIFGMFMAVSGTAPRVLLARKVEPRYYASSVGIYRGSAGLTLLPANIIAGLLYTVKIFNAPGAFVFSIAMAIISTAVLWLFVRE